MGFRVYDLVTEHSPVGGPMTARPAQPVSTDLRRSVLRIVRHHFRLDWQGISDGLTEADVTVQTCWDAHFGSEPESRSVEASE